MSNKMRKTPIKIELKAGTLYKFCSCGLSQELPICDHAHKGTGMKSFKFTPEQTGQAWISEWTSPPVLKPPEE
jgi:CDGSH-type Zn-finger protein